jgi:O-antigen/teichoic acid export membrane protein
MIVRLQLSDIMVSKPPPKSIGIGSRLSKNIVASFIRVMINGVVALALPAYLTSRLSASVYGAWVLILQMGAIVSFLDIGIQTAVAKFVAEYEARQDDLGAGRYASTGLAMTAIAATAGSLLTLGLAWQVPRIFQSMPSSLYAGVRASVILVGFSLSINLACSTFSAVFIGLQRYAIPMSLLIANRIGVAIAVCLTVFWHGGLLAMGAAVAVIHLLTSVSQIVCWQKFASHIRVSFALAERAILANMVHYCLYLGISTLGMLCVSGLDITIVGHFDYSQTAYYAVAVLPTNLMLLILSSVMGPMMPASSALSTQRTASEMGDLLIAATRYSLTLLLLVGLPLIVCGLPILRLWLGNAYAVRSVGFLRILIVANILRNLCLPYSTMVVGTGRQKSATVAAVCEAVVNLASSVILASIFGAMGVAWGTLIGSFVSVLLHFVVSMPATQGTLLFSRKRLLLEGVGRPALASIPTLIAIPRWAANPGMALSPMETTAWLLGTLCLAWFGLKKQERASLVLRATGLLKAAV